MAGGASDDEELITAINVTPLVDIVLVLLIVLMVTSSYLVSRSISVELPKAATGEAQNPTLSISLTVDKELYLDGKKTDMDKLRSRIRKAYRTDPEVKAVISADGRIAYSEVVNIIDLLRQEHVTKFAINISPIEDKTAQ